MLQGQALDAIVNNACRDASGTLCYRLFDLEWKLERPLERSWFLLRNLLCLVAFRRCFSRHCPFPSFSAIYCDLCGRAGVEPRLVDDLDLEIRLQRLVVADEVGASSALDL